jgi:glucokinase
VCTHCGAKLRPVLEQFASGPGIAKRFAQSKKSTEPSTAEQVFGEASRGDTDAIEILVSAGEALGVSAAFLVNVLDPEILIVGGGVGMAGGLYWDAFLRNCRQHIFADNSRDLPILTAKLGADAGLIGAAAIIFTRQHKKEARYAYDSK